MRKTLAIILIIGLFCKTNCVAINQFPGEHENWDIQNASHEEICGKQLWKSFQHNSKKVSRVKRIVKGEDATFAEWPWFVQLLTLSGRFFCGGALLNNQWAITAAHCVVDFNKPSSLKIRLGDTDTLKDEPIPFVDRRVENIIIHPQYQDVQGSFVSKFDVALLKLSQPVNYKMNILPICLPKDDNPLEKDTAWVQGFGFDHRRYPNVLQKMSAKILSNDECSERVPFSISKVMMCYANKYKSPCRGDSGGPLVVEKEDGTYFLAGVHSWSNCRVNGVGGSTRISEVRFWIQQTIK